MILFGPAPGPMDTKISGPTYNIPHQPAPPAPAAPTNSKQSAQTAVLALIARVCENTDRIDTHADGANIGKLFEGCAAVLRAMDEITVSNE